MCLIEMMHSTRKGSYKTEHGRYLVPLYWATATGCCTAN